jgi:branched-chain amino acid transport system permease protein
VLLLALAWVAYRAFGSGFGAEGGVPDWIRVTLAGLTLAGLYFVIASGFTLIFGLMRIVNMTHGSFYLLGAYLGYELQKHQVASWGLGLVIASLAIGIFGLLVYLVFLRWNQGQELRQALITIALSFILADQMLAFFGGGQHDIRPPKALEGVADLGIYCGGFFGCVTFPWFKIFVLGVALAIGLALTFVIRKTAFGMVVRAGVDDRAMVAALGVNVQQVNAASFLLGSILAGVGGALGGSFLVIAPGEDVDFLLKALIVVIVGGMGSLGGAAVGALALGLVEAWAPQYLPGGTTNYSILVTFLLLVFVLAVRPLGLFGRPLGHSAAEAARLGGYAGGLAKRIGNVAARRINWTVGAAVILFLVLVPPLGIVSDFNLSTLGVRSLWLGIAAVSVTFLAGYGGMVSLAQVAVYGIAGFTYADLVVKLGWSHWPAIGVGIATAVAIGFLVGLVGSRSEGIYFLMLTLAVGVIVFYFYLQVEELSGQTGVHLEAAPTLVGRDPVTDPTRLYYAALIVSAAVYLLLRYLARTPFGLTLQGIRDDPVRMGSLGYNVPLHRAVAFAVGALVASLAGIFSVFFNLQISPSSIDIGQLIVVLAIAVVGGINHLEGAWIGALVYSVIFTYTVDWAGHMPEALQKVLGPERSPTWLGLVFLAVVLASPGGLMGLWDNLVASICHRLGIGRQAQARSERHALKSRPAHEPEA